MPSKTTQKINEAKKCKVVAISSKAKQGSGMDETFENRTEITRRWPIRMVLILETNINHCIVHRLKKTSRYTC